MELSDAIDFWENSSSEEIQTDPPILIDTESIPGWVIALRSPPDRPPYIELWWESDFIEETELHRASCSELTRDVFASNE